MGQFQLIALAGSLTGDPSVGIAASRAGALGVVDLTFAPDVGSAMVSLAKFERYGRGQAGIRVDSDRLVAEITRQPSAVGTAILVPTEPDHLGELVRALRRRNIRILLEVVSCDEAELGEALDVDGLVAKGQEAGGRVGEATAFILLQQLLERTSLPTFAQGGIGLHTAAGAYVAGAAGVVLDAQLLLCRESVLPPEIRGAVARMDGSETVCLGAELGEAVRVYSRPGLAALDRLRAAVEALRCGDRPLEATRRAWLDRVRQEVDWADPARSVWPLGQDAAFAAPLARRSRTVSGVLQELRAAVDGHVATARAVRPLAEGAPLAVAHGTRYPIVQGPMTRVSDRAAFAASVAEAGALPFLALALMRGPEVARLLEETRRRLDRRPWGVGILGFVPDELRRDQMAVIREHRPSFALIAGGRPDQAAWLEEASIPTYLHVPSPGLLGMYLESGARRLVFEGRECGGHVGPRSSFTLWNTMIDTMVELLAPQELSQCHVLFAGGIHDARSGSMLSAIVAPLAEAGTKVGALLGTAYLFTQEAVAAGAIVPGFQRQAVRCQQTVLLETGPGHSTRCADTSFAQQFERERWRLVAEGRPADEIRDALERLNLGRLRIAAKGLARAAGRPAHDQAPKLLSRSEQEQEDQGMYMMGQVATLRDTVTSLAALHRDVSVTGSQRLDRAAGPALVPTPTRREHPFDAAIVGMACVFPKAPDLQTYWRNILGKVDAITEVPAERWDWRRYFDPDPGARDKVYSKWGGFLEDLPFDPARYGIPPRSLPAIEPLQLLTLEVVRAAIEDAGYADRPFPRQRTAVILGVGGGIADLGQQYALRSGLPSFLGDAAPEVLDRLPEWTEDSFAGILLNVAAGRATNRFDLGGVNYTVDAACASSLAAVYLACRELEAGAADVAIVGGADTVQNPFAYLCFSKTHALSPTGQCRTFDEHADGIAISEGVAVLVLKRLADAERDGDRVYAVIKGVAGSSDGRAKGLTAPRPEGQALAIERAYAKAGLSAATVGLIEAHGTGTVAGDQAEVETLRMVFGAAGADRQVCAIGSVKSMIGHTKCTAGVAGLIKSTLALHHRVLPPTANVQTPNPRVGFADGPFYVNTETRPWVGGVAGQRRRAGVSAFGFGGTNFHAVLEEYTDDFLAAHPPALTEEPPSELLIWAADSAEELLGSIRALRGALARGARPKLRDLAYTLWRSASPAARWGLAVVATSLDDLTRKLAHAEQAPPGPDGGQGNDELGVYLARRQPVGDGGMAFLFPGQGSQYPTMLRDLAAHFWELKDRFAVADGVLADRLRRPLSSYVFPPPRFLPDEVTADERALTETNVAQPALGAASLGLLHLLDRLGLRPHLLGGHSYGEYVALCAAGVLSEEALYVLSEVRGRCIVEAAGLEGGEMAAVAAGPDAVVDVLGSLDEVWVANANAPSQTVVSGTAAGIRRAIERLGQVGIGARTIPVACGFHSPLVAGARDRLAAVLSGQRFHPPRAPVFSNVTAAPYPDDPGAVTDLLAQHLVAPVRFLDEIEAMYRAGARLFVEVGPRAVLTGLVDQILRGRPHLAVALDGPGGPGLPRLHRALGRLWAHGAPLDLGRLFEGRGARQLDLLALDGGEERLPPTTWLVNGGRARPAGVPSPVRPLPEATPAPPPPPPGGPPRGVDDGGRGSPLAVPVPAVHLPEGTRDAALAGFQRVMRRFLETQQAVMLACLDGDRRAPAAGRADGPEPFTVTEPPPGLDPRDGSGPPPPRPTAPAAEPPAAAPPTREQLQDRLLEIVSERTGYPCDMLGLDVDIEAELSIDSIKRVEILGALLQALGPAERRATQATMERLATVKTLGGMLDRVQEALAPEDASQPPQRRELEVPRLLPTMVQAPPAGRSRLGELAGVFVITDDEGGVAEHLADLLRSRGGRVAVVRMAPGAFEAADDQHYTADLTDPGAVADLLGDLRRRHGPVIGLVHLLPLQPRAAFEAMDLAAWSARLAIDVKALFHLARQLGPELKESSSGGGWLVAAVSLGGDFAFGDARPDPAWSGHGGVAGLVKSLALEWPGVCAKVVDVGGAPAPDAARHLLAELAARDGEVEVGYGPSGRQLVRLRPAPLADDGPTDPAIGPASVLLLLGGARGITAAVARDLARRHRPTLVLVGLSAFPSAPEPPDTAGRTAPGELKAALIERLRRTGATVATAQVEQAYARLLRERELRGNIKAMELAGASVDYRQADIRDGRSLAAVIEAVYRDHGRIDGVVHGAGVIEDKLIEDKTVESFDRVFDTKVVGAFTLLRALRLDSLTFLVFFSSTAGRFGNRGQSDYAAANEVLNKLAAGFDRRQGARVTAIDWGPWSGPGMAGPEVQRRFQAQGVRLIDPAAGADALDRELGQGDTGAAEVILAAGLWPAERAVPPVTRPPLRALPLLGAPNGAAGNGDGIERTCWLDPTRHLYLQDHRLDARPVLPAAMAMELMAEVVQEGWPELEVATVLDLRVLNGVVLANGPRAVRVVGRPQPEASPGARLVRVAAEVGDPHDPTMTFYRATVELAARRPDPPPFERPLGDLVPFLMSAEEAYHRWLFHGAIFRCISTIEGMSDEGMVAAVVPSPVQRCLADAPGGDWLLDPMMVDAAPQLAILWARANRGMTALPSRFGAYRRYEGRIQPPVRCHFAVTPTSEEHSFQADASFVDRHGRVLGVLEGLEVTCSASLNRLAGPVRDEAGGAR